MENPHVQQILSYVAGNVRRQRKARGLTQQELADASEVHLRAIQNVELGRTNLSVGMLVKIADALGVAPTTLFRPAEMLEAKLGRPRKGE